MPAYPLSTFPSLIPPPLHIDASPHPSCSVVLSLYLYVSSFKRGALLSSHGTTGYPHYDFWMGRELNPRVGG